MVATLAVIGGAVVVGALGYGVRHVWRWFHGAADQP